MNEPTTSDCQAIFGELFRQGFAGQEPAQSDIFFKHA
jgi:hypothetical protein